MIAVVGDTHTKQGEDLTRYRALGNFLFDRGIRKVVMIGDHLEMQSLSSYETPGAKVMEGKRVQEEIDYGKKALELIRAPFDSFNISRRKSKRAKVPFHLHYVEGNHEFRIKKLWQVNPKFEGAFDIAKEYSGVISSFTPYKEYLYIDGVGFTHVPHHSSGPISSVYGAYRVLQYASESVVWGHTHRLDYAGVVRNGFNRTYVQGLNVGCFFVDDPEYAAGNLLPYWRGIVIVYTTTPGNFDFETIDMERVMQFA